MAGVGFLALLHWLICPQVPLYNRKIQDRNWIKALLRTTQRAQNDCQWQWAECQNWGHKKAWGLGILLRGTQSTQNGLKWAACQSGGPKGAGERQSCWPESPRVGRMVGSAQSARMRVLGGWLSGGVTRSGDGRLGAMLGLILALCSVHVLSTTLEYSEWVMSSYATESLCTLGNCSTRVGNGSQ